MLPVSALNKTKKQRKQQEQTEGLGMENNIQQIQFWDADICNFAAILTFPLVKKF